MAIPERDRPPLTPDQKATAEAYARKWKPVAVLKRAWPGLYAACRAFHLHEDDLESAAWWGVCLAAGRFDPARGVQFETVASWWIRNQVQAVLRRRVRDWERYGHVRPDLGDGDESFGWGDLDAPAAEAPEPGPDAVQRRQTLDALLDLLPGDEGRVLYLRFGLHDGPELTLEAAGQVLGLTRERVRQVEGAALDRLRSLPHRAFDRPPEVAAAAFRATGVVCPVCGKLRMRTNGRGNRCYTCKPGGRKRRAACTAG